VEIQPQWVVTAGEQTNKQQTILQKVKGMWENQVKKGARSRLNDKGGTANRNILIYKLN